MDGPIVSQFVPHTPRGPISRVTPEPLWIEVDGHTFEVVGSYEEAPGYANVIQVHHVLTGERYDIPMNVASLMKQDVNYRDLNELEILAWQAE